MRYRKPQALLNDSHTQATYRVGTPQRSETEMRLSYSIIIVRAVNGLVDPSQQGYFADSVASLAQRIGLPAWFVELRHDATHQHLPSLIMLRTAARHLVSWYWDNYWKPQRQFLLSLTESLHSLVEAGAASPSSNPVLDTDIQFLKETTFLTNIFIPAFLRSIFESQRLGGEGLGVCSEQRWEEVLVVVLKKSVHSSIGAANTIICHLMNSAVETVRTGGGKQTENAVSTLSEWVPRVMHAQRVASSSSSGSSSEHITPSSCLPAACARGLLTLGEAGRTQLVPMLDSLCAAYGEGFKQATETLLEKEGVENIFSSATHGISNGPASLAALSRDPNRNQSANDISLVLENGGIEFDGSDCDDCGESSGGDSDGDEGEATCSRRMWPLGLPKGCMMPGGGLLHLLEEV